MDMAMDTGMDKKSTNSHLPMRSALVLLLAASVAQLASAQRAEKPDNSVEPKQSITVTPKVTVTETWTDNVRLTSNGQTERITEVTPGLRIDVNKARLKGFIDYALSGIAYANSTLVNRSINSLSSNLQLEAIDDSLFVDATGTIAQQAASAFGAQSIDNTSINSNRTEVSTYRISPHAKGDLGGFATYTARLARSTTSSGGANAVSTATNEMSLSINGDIGTSRLEWAVDVKNQDSNYSTGRSVENFRALLVLAYGITPNLKVSTQVGTETDNYTSLNRATNPVHGFGFRWTPLEATKLSAILLRHSYGDTYTLSFDHRSGRAVWHFLDSQEVTASANLQDAGKFSSAYDLYYAQFTAVEPDPVARAQLVNAYLQTYGISPGTAIGAGFVSSSLIFQHRQQLSFALLGKRDTVTFIASQAESNRLDALTSAIDDFTTSPFVRQQGWSTNFAHRLTPDYTFGVLVSRINTAGALSNQSTSLRNVNLSLTGKVGKRSSATIGMRKVDSESSANPYSESAVTASLNLQL
jgi:uncharacterized protein (PEP-CTERM system associated)